MTVTTVSAGQSSGSLVVSAGDTLDVLSGGVVTNTTVLNGGTEILLGGADSSGTIDGGGSFTVSAGGVASGTVIEGSATVIGGRTVSATVQTGGQLNVNAVTSTSPNFTTAVLQAGSASFTVVSGGGFVNIGYGAVTSGTVLATPLVGGIGAAQESVNGGATAIGTVVNSQTQQSLFSGTTTGTVVSDGGSQRLNGAAIALNDAVSSGGFVGDAATLAFTEALGITSSFFGTLSGGGALVQSGPGTLVLDGNAGGFSGAVVISGGMLELTSAGAAGSAAIGFAGAGTLRIDGAGAPTNPISGFYSDDTIDLAGLTYSGVTTATVSGTAVTVTEGGVSETLTIAGAATDGVFSLAADSGGGTKVTDSVQQVVVSSGVTSTISAGQTSSGILVLSGGVLDVMAGGTAVATTLYGAENLLGGADSGGRVSSGGALTVYASGLASDAVVLTDGAVTVSSGGTASANLISGTETLVGGQALGDVLSSGGQLFVSGVISSTFNPATNTNVSTVVQYGTASFTLVGNGASVSVDPGGVTTGTVLSSPAFAFMGPGNFIDTGEIVNAGGAAVGTTVNSGVEEVVNNSGAATGAIVASGGVQAVSGAALALNDVTSSGGIVTDAGTLAFTESAGATSSVFGTLSGSGALVQSGPGALVLAGDASAFTGAVVLSGGALELSDAAAAGSGPIEFAGSATLRVDGAGAPANTISSFFSTDTIDLTGLVFSGTTSATVSGDSVLVTEGGVSETLAVAGASQDTPFLLAADSGGGTLVTDSVQQVVVSSGATLTISTGQTSSGVAVLSGGTLIVQSGGISISASVQGAETLLGHDSGGAVHGGGTLTISAGGVATSDTIGSGGGLSVLSGGTADSTVAAGSALISGSVSGLVVSGTATLVGGQARATTVDAGGSLTVSGVTSSVFNGATNTFTSVVLTSGLAFATTVNPGGFVSVEFGGETSGVNLLTPNSGAPYFTQQSVQGGVAIATVIGSGTTQNLFSGTASGTVVDSGGTQHVSNAAAAVNDAVSAGGFVDDSSMLVFTESAGVTSSVLGTLSGGGALVQSGTGTLLMSGSASGFSGAAIISGGTLELASAGAVGTASISFAGAGTLKVDGAAAPANTISSFFSDDKIDLTGLVYSGVTTAAVTGSNTVTVTEGGVSQTLTIANASAFAPFTLAPDSGGGTLVTDSVMQVVVSSGHTLTISAGQTSSGIAVLSGGALDVLSGGTSISASVQGTETLLGTDSGGKVASGGRLTVSSGGVLSGGVISGALTVFSSGAADGTLIDGTATISGGVASGVTVSGQATVDGGAASSATVADGGSLTVSGVVSNAFSSGIETSTVVQSGIASFTKVVAGGSLSVLDGGFDSSTVLMSPAPGTFNFTQEAVYTGGVAVGTVVGSGAEQQVFSGTTTGTIIQTGGQQFVSGTGLALNDLVSVGGEVADSGTLAFTEGAAVTSSFTGILSGNGTLVQSGPGVLALSGDASGFTGSAVISGGTLALTSAGAAGSAAIGFAGAGTLLVDGPTGPANTIGGFFSDDVIDLAGLGYTTGGVAAASGNTVTVTQGGFSETLSINGAANEEPFMLSPDGQGGTQLSGSVVRPIVSSGVTLTISAGQTSNNVTVLSGGTLRVLSGGTSISAAVLGAEILSHGLDSAGTVSSGGTLTVSSGGSVAGDTISGNGVLTVSSGGHASSTLVDGYATVYFGGAASGSVISGTEVLVGGKASANTVDGLGQLIVSGQTAFNGSTFSVTHTGSASFTTVSGGGYVTVDLGGVTTGTMLLSLQPGALFPGAEEQVNGGGVASGTTVNSGAEQYVLGGTTTGTVISSGGDQTLSAGAIARNDAVSGGTVVDDATLAYSEPANTSSSFFGALSGTGMLVQSGLGTLVLAGAAHSFTGAEIISGGALELASAGAAGSGGVVFAGGVQLTIDGAGPFTNSISGFTVGATIDLAGLLFSGATSASVSGNSVTVTEGGVSETLTIIGASTDNPFRLSQDTGSGTEVSVACYCAGTGILTPEGEVPVEDLAIGDLVLTVSGAAKPVRWIGRRSYAGRWLKGRRHLLPVRIRAGALGAGIPRRDLLVSPTHAMLLDGVLVQAIDLINLRSIVREVAAERVDYIHIELAEHDAIWADGAASETFVDDGSRGMFQNASSYAALYGDDPAPAVYCAPRVTQGYALQAVRDRLERWVRHVA